MQPYGRCVCAGAAIVNLATHTWEVWRQGGSVPRACEAIDLSMQLPQQGFCLWIDDIHAKPVNSN